MMNTAINVDANIPPITVVPIIWRATDPAPLAVHSGTQPSTNANEVIKIGPQANPCPAQRGVHQRLPAFVSVFGKLDDQNGVFRRQADQHDQTDL